MAVCGCAASRASGEDPGSGPDLHEAISVRVTFVILDETAYCHGYIIHVIAHSTTTNTQLSTYV
jgi:hypothetical protein